METINYNEIKNKLNDLQAEEVAIKELAKYNTKQVYNDAVARLIASGILEDWVELNKITPFKAVENCVKYNFETQKYFRLIPLRATRDGFIIGREAKSADLDISFNPRTSWIRVNGGFGAYRSWGSCGDTNMLYFRPEDIDYETNTIHWFEYTGTDTNTTLRDGSWFGEAYELKTALINTIIDYYEPYRHYVLDKLGEEMAKKQLANEKARTNAEDILKAIGGK